MESLDRGWRVSVWQQWPCPSVCPKSLALKTEVHISETPEIYVDRTEALRVRLALEGKWRWRCSAEAARVWTPGFTFCYLAVSPEQRWLRSFPNFWITAITMAPDCCFGSPLNNFIRIYFPLLNLVFPEVAT